jgi:alpha-ketoglutarate-dependent taurine dioxygenase
MWELGELGFCECRHFATTGDRPALRVKRCTAGSARAAQRPHINANYYWHSDKAHYAAPALLSMLFAVELRPNGGETEFANTEMAYRELPAATKERIAGLRVENDFAYAMANVGKSLTDEERQATPPVVHPLVRTHPETGHKALFHRHVFEGHSRHARGGGKSADRGTGGIRH